MRHFIGLNGVNAQLAAFINTIITEINGMLYIFYFFSFYVNTGRVKSIVSEESRVSLF